METEIFAEMMHTLADKIDDAESCNWAADFMLALSKANNFEMTIEFAEDEENGFIREIISKVKSHNSDKAK